MVDCLIVRTQEYFTEILYLIVKFGGNGGTSLTTILINIQSTYLNNVMKLSGKTEKSFEICLSNQRI